MIGAAACATLMKPRNLSRPPSIWSAESFASGARRAFSSATAVKTRWSIAPIDATARATAGRSSMSMAATRGAPDTVLAACLGFSSDRLSMMTLAPAAAEALAVASPIPELAPTIATVCPASSLTRLPSLRLGRCFATLWFTQQIERTWARLLRAAVPNAALSPSNPSSMTPARTPAAMAAASGHNAVQTLTHLSSSAVIDASVACRPSGRHDSARVRSPTKAGIRSVVPMPAHWPPGTGKPCRRTMHSRCIRRSWRWSQMNLATA
jgi:hypothetical protein